MNRKRDRSRKSTFSTEALEIRLCLAATPAVLTRGTLMVNGSDGNDQIWISRDDQADQILVQIQSAHDEVSPVSPFQGSYSSSAIRQITVQAGKGDDTISLVSSDIMRSIRLHLDGGDGNDVLAARMIGNLTTVGGLTINMLGGRGDDKLSVDLEGHYELPSSVVVSGGSGNDQLTLFQSIVARTTAPRVSLLGDAGNDLLHVGVGDSDGVIGQTAVRQISVSGGSGTDILTAPEDVLARDVESRKSAAEWQSFISTAVEPLVTRIPGSGVFVAVVLPDGSRETYSFGTMNAAGKPVSSESIFELGSLTKSFTGTLLADMVSHGEVSLNDPVSRYLPPNARVPSRGGHEITLLELATHTSGLPRDTKDFDRRLADVMSDLEQGIRDPAHLEALFTAEIQRDWPRLREDLLEIELPDITNPPFSYSNLGMGLLGFALSRTLGLSYEDAIQERVLRPLGLRSIFQNPPAPFAALIAEGTAFDGQTTVPPMDFNTLAGAGALRASGRDLVRYLETQTGRFPSPLAKSIGMTHVGYAPLPDSAVSTLSGLGWLTAESDNGTIIGHNGATFGFQSEVRFNESTGAGFIILMNTASDEAGAAREELIQQLQAALLLPSNPQPPSPPLSSQVMLDTSKRTLRISGTSERDAVRLIRKDSDRTLVVETKTEPSDVAIRRTYSLDFIQSIQAELNGGNDDFELITIGNVTIPLNLIVHGGQGDDGIRMEVGSAHSTVQTTVVADISGGDGDDG
ncbi:MAG: beta-lactamase family protein, partial [Planctomycetaceae bacterium]|nr:beta-lactamase family protein [Planctomycetaceae bacterium]